MLRVSRLLCKEFDWAALAESATSRASREELSKFRNAVDEASRAGLSGTTEKKIDWAHWQKSIRTPGVVDAFKKAHDQLTLPKFEDKISSQLDTASKQFVKEGEAVQSSSAAKVTELTAQYNAIKNRKPLTETTVEEFLNENPALKKEIEDEIKNHQWGV